MPTFLFVAAQWLEILERKKGDINLDGE